MNALTEIARRAFNHRLLALAALFVFALPLAGCFDNEPEQRGAFIKFLQTRIIDRPGLRIPIMSDKDIADFGPYADHYRIMNGFHHAVDASIAKDLARAMQVGSPRSLQELANNHAIISIAKTGMASMKTELDKAEAAADAAHKGLKQPADLKAVYDRAYDRMVTTPAGVFRELTPLIQNMLPTIEELAVFLDKNRNVIEYRGNTPVTKDAAVRAKLTPLLEAAVKAAEASEAGKRKLRVLAEGR